VEILNLFRISSIFSTNTLQGGFIESYPAIAYLVVFFRIAHVFPFVVFGCGLIAEEESRAHDSRAADAIAAFLCKVVGQQLILDQFKCITHFSD
jgi:hypothetical protein